VKPFSIHTIWIIPVLCLAVAICDVQAVSQTADFDSNSYQTESTVSNNLSSTDLFSVSGSSQVGYGAFQVPSQSPIQSLRCGLSPITGPLLQTGKYELSVQTTLANTWINGDNAYRLDYESLASQFSVAYGWIPYVRIEFRYEQRVIFGGILDGVVDAFHRVTGFDQDGRDSVPYGEVSIDMNGPGVNDVHIEDKSGIYAQGFSAVWRQSLFQGSRWLPAFSYAMTIRYDVDTNPYMERDFPVDLGWSAAIVKRWDDLSVFAEAGFTWYGADWLGNIELAGSNISGLLGAEYLVSPVTSVVFQYLISQGGAKNLDSFSDPSHEVLLGMKWKIGHRMLLEAALLENILIYSNSPDFGCHLGISMRF
jgi:hypothetical protein